MILKKHILDFNLYKKKVLLCVDYNVPLDAEKNIENSFRIQKTLKTIRFLLEQDAIIIIISHLGRPKRKEKQLSLKTASKELSKFLSYPVHFLNSCTHPSTKAFIDKMKPRSIVMLENLRFYKEEQSADLDFAKRLSSYADFYINEAFSTLHRNQASNIGIPKFVPSLFGFLVHNEVKAFSYFLKSPIQSKVIILGGAKISTKIKYLEGLLENSEILILAGAMSYTLLKAKGFNVGDSFIEHDYLDYCDKLFRIAELKNKKIILPKDHIAVKVNYDEFSRHYVSPDENIPEGMTGVDVGPLSLQKITRNLVNPKNIFWNGPLGIFENLSYCQGTYQLTQFLGSLNQTFKMVGGGNTINAIQKYNSEKYFQHLSTGGGAALSFIAKNGDLPSIQAIEKVYDYD